MRENTIGLRRNSGGGSGCAAVVEIERLHIAVKHKHNTLLLEAKLYSNIDSATAPRVTSTTSPSILRICKIIKYNTELPRIT